MDRARFAVAMLVLCAHAASAHVEPFPKRDRLALSPTGARVTVEYLIPAGQDARTLRELFDRDHSGALEDGERAQLVEYLAQQATRFTTLAINGDAVTLRRESLTPAIDAHPNGPLAITVTLAAPLTAPPRHVRFSDRHKDRRITIPVTVALDHLTAALPPLPTTFQDHPLEFDLN
jgi:hypothetical protein